MGFATISFNNRLDNREDKIRELDNKPTEVQGQDV